jgi:glucose/mannose transport system substrate-binding protein
MKRGLCMVCVCCAVAGCVSDNSASTVEIYSWWVSGAEVKALDDVLADFSKKDPQITITNAAASNKLNAQQDLQNRLSNGNPPDMFQVNGGVGVRPYVGDLSVGHLQPLNALAQEQAWKDHIPSAVLGSVTFGANVYGIPVDIARVNSLFYNKHLFDKYMLQPPTTMAEFVSVSQTLEQNNVSPVAIGAQASWTFEIVFKSCMAATGGASYYTEFTSGHNPYFAGRPGVDSDQTFNATLTCFETVLDHTNTAGWRSLTWDGAVKQVKNQVAAMTFMGDWAIGEFLDEGATEDDFGDVAAPDSTDTFIFTTDTFVLPVGDNNPAGAMALLREWGSAEGQSTFYRHKGSLPARDDVDPSIYGPTAQAVLADFTNESTNVVPDWALAVPDAFSGAFDPALDRFADDRNAENVVLAAKNNYGLIVTGHWP